MVSFASSALLVSCLAVKESLQVFIITYIFSPQVSPGAMLLMRVVEDFIHLIGEAQKPFQSFLAVTTNLSECIYQLEMMAIHRVRICKNAYIV